MISDTHTYLLISEELRSRIESGQLRPGDRFPTERELVAEFKVARMTLRRALEILEEDNLIDRRRGRTGGTFVRVIPPVVVLGAAATIAHQLETDGHKSTTKKVSLQKAEASHRIAGKLRIKRGDPIWYLRRLRLYDSVPVSIKRHYMPVALYPDLADADLDGSLYGESVTKQETLVPIMPTRSQRELLQVQSSQPLLRLGRIIYNRNDQPIDYIEEFVHTKALSVKVKFPEQE